MIWRRTPLGLRSLFLVYVVLIIPLFFGPYYAYIRNPDVSFTFAVFLAIVVSPSLSCNEHAAPLDWPVAYVCMVPHGICMGTSQYLATKSVLCFQCAVMASWGSPVLCSVPASRLLHTVWEWPRGLSMKCLPIAESPMCWHVQQNQAIMAIFNVAVALEDPFNSQGLDSIFVDEALVEARQVWQPLPHVSADATCCPYMQTQSCLTTELLREAVAADDGDCSCCLKGAP